MTTLTARQTRRLESDLLKQRREVLAEAHDEMMQAIERSYADVAGDVPDFGDRAAAASLCDYNDAVARRQVEAIREIDAALSRIRTYEFGRCVECGGAIPLGRLQAFPIARRCAACQVAHERTYAVGATPSL